MWLRQSLFTAVDEDGNEVFIDVDAIGRHWLMFQRKGDTPKPIQQCHYYNATATLDWFIESQNAAEREFHFMQGTTAWRY